MRLHMRRIYPYAATYGGSEVGKCGLNPRPLPRGRMKGPWTPEEDQKLIQYIQVHGFGKWSNLPKNAGN
ncbi:hypothetical protein RND71_015646 [Anisodus tanguticus]|uniref:Uncharacterized protein n=1 Tax=Anisodus tanguticus TaxID=243964 RepID=A0AAE1S604_9SOLA|nr:hypothetical protein RND71_015646 [Anisodus tanguticus]